MGHLPLVIGCLGVIGYLGRRFYRTAIQRACLFEVVEFSEPTIPISAVEPERACFECTIPINDPVTILLRRRHNGLGNDRDLLGVALTRIDSGNGLFLTILSLTAGRDESFPIDCVVRLKGHNDSLAVLVKYARERKAYDWGWQIITFTLHASVATRVPRNRGVILEMH